MYELILFRRDKDSSRLKIKIKDLQECRCRPLQIHPHNILQTADMWLTTDENVNDKTIEKKRGKEIFEGFSGKPKLSEKLLTPKQTF